MPLTDTESISVNSIIERYDSEYPFGEKSEDFCVYSDITENDVIFDGATKLPDSDIEISFEIACYWLECLTEITEVLKDCQWTVTIDDTEMVWDNNYGWSFPVN